MKKICCILLLILVCSLFLLNPVVSFAQEQPSDIWAIPKEHLAQMDKTDAQLVIRLPQISLVYEFAKSESVADVLQNCEVDRVYYWVFENGMLLRQYIVEKDDKLLLTELPSGVEEEGHAIHKLLEELLEQTAIQRVSPDIQVINQYVLQDFNSMHRDDGTVIYYETNMGDYVYHYRSGAQYLFPATVFLNFMEDIWGESQEEPFAAGNPTWNSYSKYWRYDLDSRFFMLDPFVPVIILGAVVVVALAALGIGWYVKKRKTQRAAQMQEDTSA